MERACQFQILAQWPMLPLAILSPPEEKAMRLLKPALNRITGSESIAPRFIFQIVTVPSVLQVASLFPGMRDMFSMGAEEACNSCTMWSVRVFTMRNVFPAAKINALRSGVM